MTKQFSIVKFAALVIAIMGIYSLLNLNPTNAWAGDAERIAEFKADGNSAYSVFARSKNTCDGVNCGSQDMADAGNRGIRGVKRFCKTSVMDTAGCTRGLLGAWASKTFTYTPPPEPEDSCKGVVCGAHGECEDGTCECSEGYTGSACNQCAKGFALKDNVCTKQHWCKKEEKMLFSGEWTSARCKMEQETVIVAAEPEPEPEPVVKKHWSAWKTAETDQTRMKFECEMVNTSLRTIGVPSEEKPFCYCSASGKQISEPLMVKSNLLKEGEKPNEEQVQRFCGVILSWDEYQCSKEGGKPYYKDGQLVGCICESRCQIIAEVKSTEKSILITGMSWAIVIAAALVMLLAFLFLKNRRKKAEKIYKEAPEKLPELWKVAKEQNENLPEGKGFALNNPETGRLEKGIIVDKGNLVDSAKAAMVYNEMEAELRKASNILGKPVPRWWEKTSTDDPDPEPEQQEEISLD